MANTSSQQRHARHDEEDSSAPRRPPPGETGSSTGRTAAIQIPSPVRDQDYDDLEQGTDAATTLTEDNEMPRSSWQNMTAAGMSALIGTTAVWRSSL